MRICIGILGGGVMGVLMGQVADFYFLHNWEAWVLCLPYWIVVSLLWNTN